MVSGILRASGQVVRALDCRAKHQWFEPNPRIIVGMLAHCSPSSKWVPGGNTGEVKGGEERNWPPYLTMPAAQDKCLSNGHSPTYGIVHGTHLYLYLAYFTWTPLWMKTELQLLCSSTFQRLPTFQDYHLTTISILVVYG